MPRCKDPFCTSAYPCLECRTDAIGEMVVLGLHSLALENRLDSLQAEDERWAFTREWVDA